MQNLFERPGRVTFWWIVGGTVGFLCGAILLATGISNWEPALARQAPAPTETPTVEEELARLGPRLSREGGKEPGLEAISRLEVLYARDPAYPGLGDTLARTYLAQGKALLEKGYSEEAVIYLDAALKTLPDSPEVQRAYYLATNYLKGAASYQQGDWETAAGWLRAVYLRDPGYLHVRDLLYSAYYNLGLARQVGGRLSEARGAFQMALQVKGDEPLAHNKIAELDRVFTTPTPTPPPVSKRIVIDISQQHFYAYENDTLVYSFVASTGEPGRDTAPGHYRVLDKIPMAYASAWNLKMPYWLGIYWVGTAENGIHALPILSNGQKLWDGFLGQRVSYGCVILGTLEAQTIYEWAEVGTPVEIVR